MNQSIGADLLSGELAFTEFHTGLTRLSLAHELPLRHLYITFYNVNPF